MKIRLTVDWGEFALGISITRKERIAIGLGPVLLGIYWGPMKWRCEECNRLVLRSEMREDHPRPDEDGAL